MKKHQLIDEAKQFIYQCYSELGLSKEIQEKRINDITKEIQETGSYDHTKVELEHGAKMAWRNSNRCIGRLLWQTLEVFDAREVTKAEEAYEHLLKHISFATNGGKIRSTITVFPPQKNEESEAPIRLLNHQLLRYAGYEDRYHCLPKIAAIMGLDTSKDQTLWKDMALVELNIAVIHSYHKAGVTLVDHHTAARQFKQFEKQEAKAGRQVTGNWTWLIPPVSPATTHIYHKPYDNTILTPNYFYQ